MSSRPSTDDAYDDSAASSSASPPKRRHIETSSAAPTDMHPLHHHHHRLNYHSHNNSIASNISSVPSASQPKVEVDAKARLKLKSAPHSLSSARSWGGRKKEVAIELETSFLQNHGQNNNQHFASAQESGRPSTDVGLEEQTRASSTSGHEEEAILLQTTRMLQDQKGRLREFPPFSSFVPSFLQPYLLPILHLPLPSVFLPVVFRCPPLLPLSY